MTQLRITKLELSTVESRKLHQLHQVWEALKGGRRLPDRSAFRPDIAPFLLGQITLVEVLSADSFRLRLIGTRLEDCGRRGDQGKTMDQIEPKAFSETVTEVYKSVVRTGAPQVYRIDYPLRDVETKIEQIVLPFTNGGEDVAMLLEGSDWPAGMEQNFRAISRSAPELRSA